MDSHPTNVGSSKGSDWVLFFRHYKVDSTLSLAQRIAHLLDWAAKKGAGVLVPYNVICRHIMGYSYTPRMNNEEVDGIRRKLSAVRPYLQKKYKRDLRNVSGVGARATVDSIDLVKTSLPGNVRRVNSAHAALARNAELVDVAKLPDHGPDKAWKDWFGKTVTPALKALSNDDRIAKLLPPAPEPRDIKSDGGAE